MGNVVLKCRKELLRKERSVVYDIVLAVFVDCDSLIFFLKEMRKVEVE